MRKGSVQIWRLLSVHVVKDQSGVEYSLFAPEEVHEKLKDLRKGDRFSLTKEAGQNGKKIVIKFSVIKNRIQTT